MAISTKSPDTPGGPSRPVSTPAAASTPQQYAIDPQAVLKTPIVYRSFRGKKGRGDRRKQYSRGTGDMQRFLYGLSRAAYRTARAMSNGLDTYTDRSDKSMRRNRDGMVKDFLRNASRGFADAAVEFGKAPEEIARRVRPKTVKRVFRFLTPIRID